MPYFQYQWTAEIEEHVAEHGLTPEDFEHVVNNAVKFVDSRSSDLPAAFGYTNDGRYIFAVFDYPACSCTRTRFGVDTYRNHERVIAAALAEPKQQQRNNQGQRSKNPAA